MIACFGDRSYGALQICWSPDLWGTVIESQAVGAKGALGSGFVACQEHLQGTATVIGNTGTSCEQGMLTDKYERGTSHTHAYTHKDTHTRMHTCICTCAHAHVYTCVYTYTHVFVYTDVHRRTHTPHSYIHRRLCLPCRMEHDQLFQSFSAQCLLVSGLYFSPCILGNSRPSEVTSV